MNSNPVLQWPTDEDLDRIHAATKSSIRAQQRKAKQTRTAALVLAGVCALGLTAGAVLIPATQDAVNNSAYCYSAASQESPYVQAVGYGPEAIDMCSLAWANGTLTPGERHAPRPDGPNDLPVPDLGACLRPDNVTGVFPLVINGEPVTNDRLCEALDLRPAVK